MKRVPLTAVERFFRFVREDPESKCWIWIGGRNSTGYGDFHTSGKSKHVLAHRFAYSEIGGKQLDRKLVIDHLCRQPACVNPAHLEQVENRENVVRGVGPTAVNAAKVSCIRGHEFTPENTGVYPNGWRRCRACHRGQMARSKAIKRAANGSN